jgi:hypothetical protein
MKNGLEVQLAPRLALLEVVDKDGCPDPRRSGFPNQSLQGQELAAGVDQIVYSEDPVSGLDEASHQRVRTGTPAGHHVEASGRTTLDIPNNAYSRT